MRIYTPFELLWAFLTMQFQTLKLRHRMWMDKLLGDERAQTLGGGVVGTLVGIMVSLLVAIIVVMELINSQDQAGWSTDANSTWSSLQSNIWTAITLLVIEIGAFRPIIKFQ